MIMVVMGVSGCGKSTVGRALADDLGWKYREGDDLHPVTNVAKMSAGEPLDDADRLPWLNRIADWMRTQQETSGNDVVSCSALRRSYRDRLRQAGVPVRFVYLRVTREELERRMRERMHFMPPTLLESQLATLEVPDADEEALVLDATQTLTMLMDDIRRVLSETAQGQEE